MSFIETRFLENGDYGFSGGPEFFNEEVALYSGIVAINDVWAYPLHSYEVPYNRVKIAHRGDIVKAFYACRGKLHGFRFKDFNDYSATGEPLGTSVGGGPETMQLIKTYTFGTESTARLIKKPVAGSVQLYEGVTPIASTVDTTTGIVTFTASGAGLAISADFEFDVPVRFNVSKLMTNLVAWDSHSADIPLIEDRRA